MAESKKIEEILNAVGIPIAYRQFRSFKGKTVPPPPYLVYYAERESGRGADGKDLYKQLHIVVELYTDKKTPTLENRVEGAINEFEFDKYEDYIDEERMWCVSWEFDIYQKIWRI